ncbi:MAG: bifunctional 4-hydroxy-3-methylbut-2-enyl diphosphate reductase/30S ribosomal protein S1 [Clostridiales bacterium]|nr:bifunctional 4-hydroxy-3-methylbut-2-enyl diphosphate reductase/30S ribosomal protein S1 [Clostridiales bacterium]
MGYGRCEIIVAKTAGFCFGVRRAINAVETALKESDSVCTLGPIVHNNAVVEHFEKKGVRVIDNPSQAPDNSTVVIRAHGVTKAVSKELDSKGINCKDATCPKVRKLQQVVDEKTKEGYVVFIAGDKNHPEIIGVISDSTSEYYTFKNTQELQKVIDEHPELVNKHIFVVPQTTFSIKEWQECIKIINLVYTNATIFDTICGATEEKQKEAIEISKKSDKMIVIGSHNSANTVKLKEVCQSNCPTHLVESASDIDKIDFTGCSCVGVTAGASTPDGIIKEVLKTMSDLFNEKAEVANGEQLATSDFEEMSFAEALEESLKSMSTDQKIKGVIVGISPNEIQVDIERKHAGYIPYSEYSYDPTVDPAKDAKIGDVIEVIIMKTNDAEGTVMLSKRRVDAANAWNDIISAHEEGTIVEATVTDVIKGGVLATTKGGVRVFIPASLAVMSRSESLESLLHTKVSFKVIEVNKPRRRAVGSIKEVIKNERKELEEKFWSTAQVGQVYTGVVKSMTSYGAFVDIGGVDGMIHISELSWKRIKHPSEILNIGDTVEVYIKSLDDNKISLGYKKAEDNPWEVLKTTYSVGDVITTKIVGMTSFGAFAQIIPGIDGLIHISQIADRHIEKPQDILSVGEEVTAKITEIDYDKKRVSISIRALIEPKDELTDSVE